MVKRIAIVVVLLIVAVLGFAATKPDTFRVQRSTSIKAPPEKIFALINDFRKWEAWSPWEKMDPAMKKSLSGSESGKGAVYAWEGNDKVGKGRMEITNVSEPKEIHLQLDFIEPFECRNAVDFTLVNEEDNTNVTWDMHGPNPYFSKLMQVFMNMDRMVGKDFETGLANLKSEAEKSANAIQQLADDYFAKRPSLSLHSGLSDDEARFAQSAFVTHLMPKLGRRVGFKVGLTSKAVQESLGASAPVRGVLLSDMLLNDGAQVSANFGARPIWEPDLIVVVKDLEINDAKTPLDVALHLSEIVAFIELPDRITAETEKVDGNLITAINCSARLGVLGQRRKIEPTAEFLTALEKMTVVAYDQTGAELAKAQGDALLGHPFNPVLWLINELAGTGEILKPGDLISLGSFARPQTPQAGQSVTVQYDGLPGGRLEVSVNFIE